MGTFMDEIKNLLDAYHLSKIDERIVKDRLLFAIARYLIEKHDEEKNSNAYTNGNCGGVPVKLTREGVTYPDDEKRPSLNPWKQN